MPLVQGGFDVRRGTAILFDVGDPAWYCARRRYSPNQITFKRFDGHDRLDALGVFAIKIRESDKANAQSDMNLLP